MHIVTRNIKKVREREREESVRMRTREMEIDLYEKNGEEEPKVKLQEEIC